ncbi:MAG: TlpA family protein disulfide reductase [Ignavibacteria bacterium]|nr:TlpA family protein disulfide reductase [Ignavibacteria bacterium]
MKKIGLIILIPLLILILNNVSLPQTFTDFTLPDLENNDVTLSTLIQKGPVMISFWATWCSPCKEELKKMQIIYEKYKEYGFEYLAINTDNQKSIAKVKSYITSQGYTFKVLLDFEKKVIEAYGGKEDEIPYSVLIGKDKTILNTHLGFKSGDEVKIEEEIKAALGIKD